MKKIFIVLLLIISMLSVVYAVPEFKQLDNALTIDSVGYQYHPLNTDYYLHTHSRDSSTGILLNTSNLQCEYHLYGERVNWNVITEDTLTTNGESGALISNINASHFNETGDYSILVWCEDSVNQIGGTLQYYFEVYEDEKSFNYFYEIVILVVLVVALLLALTLKLNVLGIITSIVILIIGLYYMLDVFLLGLVTFLIGIFMSMYFGFKGE